MADVYKIGANGIEYDACDTAARLGVQTANSNISSLRTDLTADEADIADLQSDMTEAQGNISTIQEEMSDAQSDIASLQSAVSALQFTSTTGYCKMPDGTLIAYGVSGGYGEGSKYLGVSLPVSFVGAYAVTAIGSSPDEQQAGTYKGQNVIVYNKRSNYFALVVVGTYVHAVNWIAIGRWK